MLELGAPAFLAGRRASRPRAILAFGMHWGTYFPMDVKLRYPMSGLGYLSRFHVRRPVLRIAGRPRRGARAGELAAT